MIATAARISYVKRFKMEMDLREVLAAPALPAGHAWVPWDATLLETHAEVLFLSFRLEIDAAVFPSFGDRLGCSCLMAEMTRKPGFLASATWLLIGPGGYVGSVQGLRECSGVGAIQNLGVVAGARGHGFGTALLLQALHGFRTAGLARGRLEVTAQNESAIRLYRRLGFRCCKTVYKAVAASEFPDDGACL
jgi:ribosomal protein S18 acetylase RimI-like enzyme